MNKSHKYMRMVTALCAVIVLTVFGLACSGDLHGEDSHDHAKHVGAKAEAGHEEHKGCGGHDDHTGHAPAEAKDAKAEEGHEGCTGHDDHDKHAHAPAHDAKAEAGHEDHGEEGEAGHDGHEGHNHGPARDMESPVETLFAQHCEHAIATYTCEECRYEVGVVKVPKALMTQGLVETLPVQQRDFDSEIELTGEIQFDAGNIVRLGPRAAGVVRRIKVDLGQKVKAGQVVAELESVELAEAQSAYLEAAAERRLAKKERDRQKALRESNITSEREFLEAQQRHESAAIRSASARQKLLRMGLRDRDISALNKKGHSGATGLLPVVAPFGGEILELQAVRGERVEPGAGLVLLGDVSTLWMWVDVYEDALGAVRRAMQGSGLPASVAVRAYPEERFTGTLNYIAGTMDEATRTVKARILLENPAGKLKPGMFARVRLGLKQNGKQLAVPVDAVLLDGEDRFAFIHHKDEYFVRRRVQTGRQIDGYVEITGGLQPGQTVVSTGSFLLKSDVLRSKMGEGCAH